MRTRRCGFSLIEILTVILIVTILAAAVMPILRGRVERAKWSEANAAAGMIKNAVKVYFAETGAGITGSLSEGVMMNLLDIQAGDLSGTYFVAGDYTSTRSTTPASPPSRSPAVCPMPRKAAKP